MTSLSAGGERGPDRRAPLLGDDDYRLSMRLAPRRARGEDPDLRTVLLHRLSDTDKAVARRGLKDQNSIGIFCEPCGSWARHPRGQSLPQVYTCGGCGRRFRVETLVYEEIEQARTDAPTRPGSEETS